MSACTLVWTRHGSWLETRGEDGCKKFADLGKLTIGEAEKQAFLRKAALRITGERNCTFSRTHAILTV